MNDGGSIEVVDATEAPVKVIELASTADLARYLDAPRIFKLGEKDGRRDDRDMELFIAEECYQQYLQVVQQGLQPPEEIQIFLGRAIRYSERTTFEEFLGDMLDTCRWRRHELDEEMARGYIDQHYKQQCLELVDWTEAALRRYLEKSKRQRLIGV